MSQLENSINLFEDMASAISAKYLANVKIMTVKKGARPDFDELMSQLKLLEQELTKQGIEVIEAYTAKNGGADEITAALKEVIQKTIEAFIKQL